MLDKMDKTSIGNGERQICQRGTRLTEVIDPWV